jgi:hypothetical protein
MAGNADIWRRNGVDDPQQPQVLKNSYRTCRRNRKCKARPPAARFDQAGKPALSAAVLREEPQKAAPGQIGSGGAPETTIAFAGFLPI